METAARFSSAHGGVGRRVSGKSNGVYPSEEIGIGDELLSFVADRKTLSNKRGRPRSMCSYFFRAICFVFCISGHCIWLNDVVEKGMLERINTRGVSVCHAMEAGSKRQQLSLCPVHADGQQVTTQSAILLHASHLAP